MKNAIVFSSRTGNTALLAETLRDLVPDCCYFGAPDPAALEADRIYVGFWTDKGSCDGDSAAFLKTVTSQQVFLFGTAGFGGDPDYFAGILKKTVKYLKHPENLAGTYMCQGKMPMTVRQRYEKLQAGHIPVPNLQSMLENFDRALSHPDSGDLNGLREAVTKTL